MSEWKNPLRNIKVVLQPGSPKLRRAVTLLIVCAILAVAALVLVSRQIHSGTAELLDAAAELEGEITEMQDRIDNAGTPQVIEKIAREELGLVDPNTVIINPDSQ